MANRRTSTLLLCALAVLSLVGAASCRQDTETAAVPSDFEYPDSKFWAHCVSTVALGRERSPLFDGLEVDVNYSESQDKIFMGHELYDTIHGLTAHASKEPPNAQLTNSPTRGCAAGRRTSGELRGGTPHLRRACYSPMAISPSALAVTRMVAPGG